MANTGTAPSTLWWALATTPITHPRSILTPSCTHLAQPWCTTPTLMTEPLHLLRSTASREVGSKAVVTKLTQLHGYQVYSPVRADSLTHAEQMMVLESLMSIIKKHNGRVRAHAVTDGSKERCQPRYKKEDGASPTIAPDSIMITGTINAHKHQDIATVDIPGAFLHTYNDKDTFMLLCGGHVQLMVQVNPARYRNYVIYKKNDKALLYVKLLRQSAAYSKVPSFSTRNLSMTSRIMNPLSSSNPTTHALLTPPLLDSDDSHLAC
jgi:hypothetical protein